MDMENQPIQEPEESFDPLPPEVYRSLYDIEMSGFIADAPYYLDELKGKRNILELGCGSGRITRILAKKDHNITAADLSLPMLLEAKRQDRESRFICLDMRSFYLRIKFDGILIGYNTLNLLGSTSDIMSCLAHCRSVCQDNCSLLLQIFTPTDDILNLAEGETSFQFQIFDRPGGGKIVKETLRRYSPASRQLLMTERYRIRPMQDPKENKNYLHQMQLCVPTLKTWRQMLQESGFSIHSITDRYSPGTPAGKGVFLVHAVPA